jgi:murein DD-endopeptidase MepM/ murein hydrolase activator NlpD
VRAKVPKRHHAGIDLASKIGEVVSAMHGGQLRTIMGWPGGTIAVVVDDGKTGTLYGGLAPDSYSAFDLERYDSVQPGQPIGYIGPGYDEILHVELRAPGAAAEQKWWWGGPPPTGLLDPRPYLQAAAAPRPAPPSSPSSWWPPSFEWPSFEWPSWPTEPPTQPSPTALDNPGAGLGLALLVLLVLWGGDR